MQEFLSALWPEFGYGELRCIKNHNVEQSFHGVGWTMNEIADAARGYDAHGYDVYMGVLRRRSSHGTSDNTFDPRVLWADIDFKNGDRTLDQILAFPIPPSIIVDSGYGYHLYWLLREAVKYPDARAAMKGIAKTLGGDHTYDAARVLRLPGTHNHKHGTSVPVRLLKLDITRRYAFSDFVDYTELGSEGRGTPAKWSVGPRLTKAQRVPFRVDLPVWLDELIRNGVEKGRRSEQCFKVMVWLIRYGWTEDEILETFAKNADGIGEKMWDMQDVAARRWFNTTYRAAEAAA